MQFITIREIIEIIIMIVAIGFIASRFFRRKPLEDYDPLKHFNKNHLLESIKYGAMIAAPAIVFHELAHKFVAMSFGATATIHAPITMYIIVIFMILVNFPVIFFVGGYVTHTALPAYASTLVAIAGPLTNLVLWIVFRNSLKTKIGKRYHNEIVIMGRLNLFLFAFNMIPIPGFDGFNFFRSLFVWLF